MQSVYTKVISNRFQENPVYINAISKEVFPMPEKFILFEIYDI